MSCAIQTGLQLRAVAMFSRYGGLKELLSIPSRD